MRGCILATDLGHGGGWGRYWANYSPSEIRTRFARLQAIGVDTVIPQTTGIGVGVASPGGYGGGYYPPDSQLYGYVSDFIVACRQYGMMIGISFAGGVTELLGKDGTWGPTNLPVALKTYGWFASLAPDLVRYVDCANEFNFNTPTSWSSATQRAADMQLIMSSVRAILPGVPVTFSAYCAARTDFGASSGNLFQLQAQAGCDFHGYHPYNNFAGSTTITPAQAPAGADMALLESQSWFLGWHLQMECGVEQGNSAAATAAWFAGLGDQHRRARSLGGNAFSDRNFDGQGEVGNYGLFDNGGSPVVSATTQVALWPKCV